MKKHRQTYEARDGIAIWNRYWVESAKISHWRKSMAPFGKITSGEDQGPLDR